MAVRTPMRVGLVGCGNISDIYLQNGAAFRDIVFTACADLNAEAASGRPSATRSKREAWTTCSRATTSISC